MMANIVMAVVTATLTADADILWNKGNPGFRLKIILYIVSIHVENIKRFIFPSNGTHHLISTWHIHRIKYSHYAVETNDIVRLQINTVNSLIFARDSFAEIHDNL